METRKQEILNIVVKEFIKSGEPVGSRVLVANYKINYSPATVRGEMLELTEEGYLFQPHVSAGRVPTDLGYRFFVDNLAEVKPLKKAQKEKINNNLKEISREGQPAKKIARAISDFSDNIGICGFVGEDEFFSSGLRQIMKRAQDMKFQDPFEILDDAFSFFDDLDREMDRMFNLVDQEIEVLIGKESKIKELDDLSLVLSRCGKDGIVGIAGPKRMDYAKNIALIDFAKELINSNF